MNKQRLSIKILMEKTGVRFSDIAPAKISTDTLSRALKAVNITDGKLTELGCILNAKEYIHFVFILDRLYSVCNLNDIFINPVDFVFPSCVPDDIQHLLKQNHPIFKKSQELL